MFLVCGEALMDVFSCGDTARGVGLDARIGGSPFNVAVGLARLGQPVAFFGGVSTDFLGDRLVRALRDEGVALQAVQRLDAPTTLSMVGVDSEGRPSYAFHGHGAADRLLGPDAVARLDLRPAVVHVGSYVTVVEPAAAAVRALVEREHGRALIAFDPNVRLNVEPRVERWREALEWLVRRADVVKISEEDLGLLYPGQAAETLAAGWLRDGAGLVVLTRGEHGSQAFTAAQRVSVPAERCPLVDTVGAGDTFQAALLTWLAEHACLSAAQLRALPAAGLAEALAFAGRAAAITCSRQGADLPRRAELAAPR
jgi:fructokinase